MSTDDNWQVDVGGIGRTREPIPERTAEVDDLVRLIHSGVALDVRGLATEIVGHRYTVAGLRERVALLNAEIDDACAVITLLKREDGSITELMRERDEATAALASAATEADSWAATKQASEG